MFRIEKQRFTSVIDLRAVPVENRKEVLGRWFNHHLHCTDGKGHSWKSHNWVFDLKVWLWGPCAKCGIYRLTQTRGNYFEWHPDTKFWEGFVIDDCFKIFEKDLSDRTGGV